MTHLENAIIIKQNLDLVYKLCENIEKFPEFMPHVKKSIITLKQGNKKHVTMSGVISGIKSSWASESTTKKNKSIYYDLLEGSCKVMRGEWVFEKVPEGTKVTIIHDFDLGWPIIGKLLSSTLVKYWVEKYSRLTLNHIKLEAESRVRKKDNK
jgi:ribosome-associated toxin RatA of RatAB toxin-antitoxin module